MLVLLKSLSARNIDWFPELRAREISRHTNLDENDRDPEGRIGCFTINVVSIWDIVQHRTWAAPRGPLAFLDRSLNALISITVPGGFVLILGAKECCCKQQKI